MDENSPTDNLTNPADVSPEMLQLANVMLMLIRQRDTALERAQHDLHWAREVSTDTHGMLVATTRDLRASEDALVHARSLNETRLKTILELQHKLEQSRQTVEITRRGMEELKKINAGMQESLRNMVPLSNRDPAEVTPELGCPVCGAGGMWTMPFVDPATGEAELREILNSDIQRGLADGSLIRDES